MLRLGARFAGLTQSLGLGVMVEGIETESERDLLARFGCDCYKVQEYCAAYQLTNWRLLCVSIICCCCVLKEINPKFKLINY